MFFFEMFCVCIYIYINYIFKDNIYMYIFVCKYFFSMYYTNDDNIYI